MPDTWNSNTEKVWTRDYTVGEYVVSGSGDTRMFVLMCERHHGNGSTSTSVDSLHFTAGDAERARWALCEAADKEGYVVFTLQQQFNEWRTAADPTDDREYIKGCALAAIDEAENTDLRRYRDHLTARLADAKRMGPL